MCHFETALHRHRHQRAWKDIGLSVLEELKNTTDIVLVSLGEFGDVLVGKERL
jgi:hypothetical protein